MTGYTLLLYPPRLVSFFCTISICLSSCSGSREFYSWAAGLASEVSFSALSSPASTLNAARCSSPVDVHTFQVRSVSVGNKIPLYCQGRRMKEGLPLFPPSPMSASLKKKLKTTYTCVEKPGRKYIRLYRHTQIGGIYIPKITVCEGLT